MFGSKRTDFHEDFARDEEIEGSSDRSFGLVFTAVFLIVGVWPAFFGNEARFWSFAVAAVFLVLSLARSALLAPLNRLWMKFGLLLSRIVNPLVIGLLFYTTVTPIGLIMRALGKDLLRLRFEPEAESYWIEREPPGPAPESMKNQF
jgi:hypothetical protein